MFTSGSPSSGNLQIGIALVLKDRFSNQAREASSSIKRLHQEAKVATNANLQAVRNMATAGAAIGTAMLGGMARSVTLGAEFIDIMTQVGAIAREDGVKVKELFDQAQSLGRKTMFTSRDIASGMQYFAMAGMSTREIKANMGAVANLAAATRTELGGKMGAADIMTNIMRMFRIESTERNATRMADVLTTAVTRSNISLLDLAESIKYAGTTATNLGASVEQTAAFVGILGNAGIQGSMAGTAIANSYRYLSKSIGNEKYKGHHALKSLGLGKQDFVDAQGRLIDMGMAMHKVAMATKGLDDVTRFNKFIDIFGVRGERSASSMMKAAEDYKSLLNEIQSASEGRSQGIMDERMASIAGRIKIMTSALENLKVTFTESIAPIVSPIMNFLAFVFDVLRRIVKTPILGNIISGFFAIGTAVLTIRLGILALKATMRLMFNDSLVSLRNMFAVMTTGWKGAQISATQYQATEAAIIAQRKAGIVSNYAGMRAGSMAATGIYGKAAVGGLAKGDWVGNTRMSPGGYFWVRDASGGIKRTTMAKSVSMATSHMKSTGISGAAKGVIAGSAAMRGLSGVLKGGFALLGGPIGIGITAIAFLLPAIISSLSKNRKAQESNTNAVITSLEDQRRRDAELRANGGLTDQERLTLLIKSIQNLTEQLSKGDKPIAQLTINVDGKTSIKKMIKESNSEEVINLSGIKG